MAKPKNNTALLEEYNRHQSPKLKDALLIENGGLVREIIRRKFNYPNHYDDLYQEGLIALSNCIDKYDPKRGTTLSSYAYIAIRNRMINYLAKCGRQDSHDSLSEHLISTASPISYDSFMEILESTPQSMQDQVKTYLTTDRKGMKPKDMKVVSQAKEKFRKELL